MQHKDSHIFIGMLLDLSPTKHKPEFMCDAHNVRVTSSDKEDTYLSLTNEKGTLKVNLSQNIEGYYLGHCVVSIYNEDLKEDEDIIILFCTKLNSQDPDYIYKITLNDDVLKPVQLLYNGNLNFNIEHPIETFFISEAVDINKVYWNDGYNQPRVINLNNIKADSNFDTQFDFVPTLNLEESITVERLLLGGSFLPGVILYAFSYYNKFGQLSNIFYTSLLNYIMFEDRGGSPEEFVPNSFKITISNWLEGFDYLRIYSIHRTTLDAVPQCKIVLDIDLRDITDLEIVFIDNGLIGEFTDPALFPYIGGLDIIALTWDLKDNTLFLGNITINKPSIANIKITEDNEDIDINTYVLDNADDILFSFGSISKGGINPGFKCGEEYRIGFLAQYKDGSWSEPIWIKDFTSPLNNKPHIIVDSTDIYSPAIKCILPLEVLSTLKDNGYKNVRGLCVFPKVSERNIVALGIVTPTLITNFTNEHNIKNISSWFFRPYCKNQTNPLFIEYNHGKLLNSEFSNDYNNLEYYIDRTKLDFYSPDIEFNEDLNHLNNESLLLQVTGIIPFEDNQIQRKLTISSVTKSERGKILDNLDTSIVTGVPQLQDCIVGIREKDGIEYHDVINQANNEHEETSVTYITFPWQASGSINNDYTSGNITGTSILKTNVLSLLRDSNRVTYGIQSNYGIIKVKGQKVIVSEEEILEIVDNDDETTFKYLGNIDTVLLAPSCKYVTYNYNNYIDPSNSEFNVKHNLESNQDIINYYNNLEDKSYLKYINGKNLFTTLKYKSSKHVVLNIDNDLLPRFNSILLEAFFIFNDFLLNNIFYYKPNYNTYLGVFYFKYYNTDQVILDNDFEVMFISEELFESGRYNIRCPEAYHEINKYNEEPFLMVLDLENYPTIVDHSDFTHTYIGDKYLCLARPRYNSNNNGKLLLLLLDYTLGGLDTNSIIRIPYTDGELLYTSYFIYNSAISRWVILEYNESPSEYSIGYKVTYDENIPVTNYTLPHVTSANGYMDYLDGYDSHVTNYFIDNLNTNGDWDKLNYFLLSVLDDELHTEIINDPYQDIPKLFLCDLYRDQSTINNRFGGTTQEALKSNLWIPASNTYNIDYLLELNHYILIDRGDTWFWKYYCLKTYPYATTDENLIIDKAGFYCETRYNLHGIYDKDKPSTLLFINKDSFNKFNYVYNQSDNFFNYRILDKEFYTRDNFPYSFFWTKEKVNTAEIDNYTNLNLVTSLDVNSVGGEISKILVHNGLIYCFLPDGINRILFNSRVLIPVSDGVPIEIANSAKLEGVSSITNTIGCSNKWAAISTNSGLFFLDNRRKGLFLIGDEGFPLNLTAQFNMSNWFNKHNLDKWGKDSSGNWIGTKLCDDYNGNDIYLIKENDNNNEGALVYSKRIGQFTSFMSYGETDSIFNAGEHLYALKTINGEVDLYKMNSGDYNYFFDQYEPFDFTFISTGDTESGGPATDKTFTNVELRATFSESKYFDYILSKNDYLDTGICTINKNILATNRHFSRGDTARKFRIWRTDIPRVLEGNKRTLNRVRNIWTKIKLGITKQSSSNFKMELHDINVLYHI